MEPTLDDHHDKSVLPAVMQVKVFDSKNSRFTIFRYNRILDDQDAQNGRT